MSHQTKCIENEYVTFEKNISDVKKELPEKLRKIRVLKNYSQEYVSEQIDVSLSSYARYESGKVEIDFYSVAKLADLYKMTIDEIYHYGEMNFHVEEAKEFYNKTRNRINVLVELDGDEDTLNLWVKRLTTINKAI